MKKVKICKKLSKLLHIDCSDMDCNCLEMEEFVAVKDLLDIITSDEWGDVELRKHLTNTLSNENKKERESDILPTLKYVASKRKC